VGIWIREAGEVDYEALERLFEIVDALHRDGLPHVFRAAQGPARSRAYLEELTAGEESAILIAEGDDGLVGFINVQMRESPDARIMVARRYAVVDALAVEEAARRRGVGRRLMCAAEDWARQRGAGTLELTVWEFNAAAIAFYEAMGYVTARRRLWKTLG
jgi:ribosomal protein S18 acetylase RimI-like enzyme